MLILVMTTGKLISVKPSVATVSSADPNIIVWPSLLASDPLSVSLLSTLLLPPAILRRIRSNPSVSIAVPSLGYHFLSSSDIPD